MFHDSGAWCSELKGDINFVINMKMYNVNVNCMLITSNVYM